MKIGICASVADAAAAKNAGWEFVESSVQDLLKGLVPDDQWQGLAQTKGSVLPNPSANCLVPAALKITGPQADQSKLRQYMTKVLERAEKVGIKMLVFGSGGARNVPDGFDREKARQQIIDFARTNAPLAQKHGVTLVTEPLCKPEVIVLVPEQPAQPRRPLSSFIGSGKGAFGNVERP